MVARWNMVELYALWGKQDKLCKMLSSLLKFTDQMDADGHLSAFDKKGLEGFDNHRKKCKI